MIEFVVVETVCVFDVTFVGNGVDNVRRERGQFSVALGGGGGGGSKKK